MPAGDIVRLGLIGYGRIAPRHLEVFRALGCEIVAACNRSEVGRRRARDEGGIARTYASIPEMVAKEKLDGIICCASAENIFDAACLLLPSRIPLLLEKPPGLSVADAEELHRRSTEYGTPVMVALNRRHYSVLKRAIADAGGLSAVNAVFVDWSENPSYLLNQRHLSSRVVERMMFANSLHGLDLITHLAGSVESPQILGGWIGEPFGWQMALQGISTRGVLVSFRSTWNAPCGWSLSFTTTGRRYVFAPLETCARHEFGVPQSSIVPDEADNQYKPGFFAQAQEFLEIIRKGQSNPSSDISSVIPSMRLADSLTSACAASHAGLILEPRIL